MKAVDLGLWITCYCLSNWVTPKDISAIMLPIFDIALHVNSHLNVLLIVIIQFHLSFIFCWLKYDYFIFVYNSYTFWLCYYYCILPQNLLEGVRTTSENERIIGRWWEKLMRNPDRPITQVGRNLCGARGTYWVWHFLYVTSVIFWDICV